MSKLIIRKTYLEWPWRYQIIDGSYGTVALTLTLWGAKRLVAKENKLRGEI